MKTKDSRLYLKGTYPRAAAVIDQPIATLPAMA